MNFVKIYDRYIKISDIYSIIELEDNDLLVLLKNTCFKNISSFFLESVSEDNKDEYIKSQRKNINSIVNEKIGIINSNFYKNLITFFRKSKIDTTINKNSSQDKINNFFDFISYKYKIGFTDYGFNIYIEKFIDIYNDNLYNELDTINWKKIDCVIYVDRSNRTNIDKVLNYGL